MIHKTSASPACGYKMMLHFLFMSRLLVSELTPGRQPPQSFLGVSQHLVSHVLQSKSVSFLIYICSYARTVPTIALLFWAANFFFFFFFFCSMKLCLTTTEKLIITFCLYLCTLCLFQNCIVI